MMPGHQRRWSWLQSYQGKEIESAQVHWGQDIGSSPRMRVGSGDDPESWGQPLSGFHMTIFSIPRPFDWWQFLRTLVTAHA